MSTKSPIEDEPGAEERFDRAIKAALATKPKPHKPHSGELKKERKANAHRALND